MVPTQPVPIARWDDALDAWVTIPLAPTLPIFVPSVAYSATFPASGMTRGGTAFALPTWAHLMDGSASSSLLPTPTVSEANGPGLHGDGGQDLRTTVSLLPTPARRDFKAPGDPAKLPGRMANRAQPLTEIITLLPTPKATNNENQQTPRDGAQGYGLNLGMALTLLPTPAVNDMGAGKTVEHWDEWTAAMQAKHGNGNGHGKSLAIEGLRIGASTLPPLPDGPQSWDVPLPLPLRQDPKVDNN